jgi:hypothetical protein
LNSNIAHHYLLFLIEGEDGVGRYTESSPALSAVDHENGHIEYKKEYENDDEPECKTSQELLLALENKDRSVIRLHQSNHKNNEAILCKESARRNRELLSSLQDNAKDNHTTVSNLYCVPMSRQRMPRTRTRLVATLC